MFNDIQSDFSYTQRKNDPPKPDTRSLEELAKKMGVHIPCDEVYSEDRRREIQMELVRLKLSQEIKVCKSAGATDDRKPIVTNLQRQCPDSL
jgi:hypothetical protein